MNCYKKYQVRGITNSTQLFLENPEDEKDGIFDCNIY